MLGEGGRRRSGERSSNGYQPLWVQTVTTETSGQLTTEYDIVPVDRCELEISTVEDVLTGVRVRFVALTADAFPPVIASASLAEPVAEESCTSYPRYQCQISVATDRLRTDCERDDPSNQWDMSAPRPAPASAHDAFAPCGLARTDRFTRAVRPARTDRPARSNRFSRAIAIGSVVDSVANMADFVPVRVVRCSRALG